MHGKVKPVRTGTGTAVQAAAGQGAGPMVDVVREGAVGTHHAGAAYEPGHLTYPHMHAPRAPETIEVADGILWARIPLPFRLNHVNVWLIREADGWTIVDSGTADANARAAWDHLLAGPLSAAPILRQIATHGHTDHVGLAGWLAERASGAPYHITLVEWLSAQIRVEESQTPMRPENIRFLRANGCDPETIESFFEERRRMNAHMVPLPPAVQRLRDGQTLRFGGRDWRVMVCGGHAAEHASFWCAAEKILIAGDQILSKISPMIGVFPLEPAAEPLGEYLASLERFRALPADALVLPSHGIPFYGLHTRVEELASHHEHRLDMLERLITGPKTGMELARGLFQKAVAEGQGRHAFSETLAHAHHLVTRGRVIEVRGEDGTRRFDRAR